ncbi:MAG: hypothetical protein PWP68_566 [Rikenellaceae bacterium]|nr:hypothetical protein [Rikenellaceae bacterium]
MIKVWINKQIKEMPTKEFEDSLIFNILSKNNKSNVKTHVEELWRRFGEEHLSAIYEDLLIIGMSVFCVDKRIPRGYFPDNWTRKIYINIPVIELETWNEVKTDLEIMLNFLSGDDWKLSFRISQHRFRGEKQNKSYKLIGKDRKFDGVSLFSGGLDSFCGALKLLSEKKRICFVGFKEYGLLKNKQYELFEAIDNFYKGIDKELLLFNITPMRPIGISEKMAKLGSENTSRSRSLIFLVGALAVASLIGDKTPVYMPENGFIGINVPLTDSRLSSCSTRTTHPYFIKLFSDILNKIGINDKIINFYSSLTKGEIVSEFKDNPLFREYACKTISCSHPCQSRYDKITPPINCGYCYPCIIRRAAMNKISYEESYNPNYKLTKDFIMKYNDVVGKSSDLKAVLLGLKNYLIHKDDDNYIKYILLKSGPLKLKELYNYKRIYKESMKEILEMIISEDKKNNGGLLEYLDSKNEKEGIEQ